MIRASSATGTFNPLTSRIDTIRTAEIFNLQMAPSSLWNDHLPVERGATGIFYHHARVKPPSHTGVVIPELYPMRASLFSLVCGVKCGVRIGRLLGLAASWRACSVRVVLSQKNRKLVPNAEIRHIPTLALCCRGPIDWRSSSCGEPRITRANRRVLLKIPCHNARGDGIINGQHLARAVWGLERGGAMKRGDLRAETLTNIRARTNMDPI